MSIIIECAWCHVRIGVKEGRQWGAVLTPITHSICPSCNEKLFGGAKKTQGYNQSVGSAEMSGRKPQNSQKI
jgi:hypothetical protein